MNIALGVVRERGQRLDRVTHVGRHAAISFPGLQTVTRCSMIVGLALRVMRQ
jgi:hypothetical protein